MSFMKTLKNIARGLTPIAIFGLIIAIAAGPIMESYSAPLDTFFGSTSFEIVSEETDEADWVYKSKFKNVKEAVDGLKEFAIRESQETYALLKNQSKALPIAKDAGITLLGFRAYVPVYGNDMGAAPDTTVINGEKSQIYNAFAERGFKVNPNVLSKYKASSAITTMDNGEIDASKKASDTAEATELSLGELGITANDYTGYKDAAIVVVGRPGGERKEYKTGGTDSTTTNILGLSAKEKAVIEEAKSNFDKVIVLINSVNMLELKELQTDNGIDAILWIGYPGVYGFYGVADVLNGTVSPSANLGDIYAANTAVNPAMVSFGTDGKNNWANVGSFDAKTDNVNSYLINQEGIYTGYRYYETRYADVVAGVSGAAQAAAGTYVTADTKVATVDGTWNYANEVVYPFGYGLSYTTFEQALDSVTVMGTKKTARVTVTVKNTGGVAGKSVIQLYAQSPYTKYDKDNGIEKSAIQLMDYEKTRTLKPKETQTITMEVDLESLASYDAKGAKTYILDDGDYYFAIGDNSHDALNNILAKQGYSTEDGMTANGNASNAYQWTWSGSPNGVDVETYSFSKAGVEVTNRLSSGDASMDINSFEGYANTAKYLTRSDWNGTYPKAITNLSANGRLAELLKNDFVEVKTNDDVSEYVWGVDNGRNIFEMKGAAWDDPRWGELVDQVPISEFLAFAQSAFHNIQKIPSVSYAGNKADDGPGGSDGGKMKDAMYQGQKFAEMEGYDAKYDNYGTRIAPTPTNLAYSWNKELAYENGEIILGESTLIFNYPIMIGPGMNLHRHAYNGRGAEYYSEDPILSGYTGSAVVQGAQSKGCLVNVKHFAFNDQEGDRSGIATFMNEQTAREMELRNFQQVFEANGKPASFRSDKEKQDAYTVGALGVMTSFNRIGAVAPSANKGACVDILRDEWDFKGYSVTDFTGVAPKASPKESILYGTTAFCGFGVSVDYWNEDYFKNDAAMCAAIKQNIKYVLYSLANSAAMNGQNITSHRVELPTPWRNIYKGLRIGFGIMTGLTVAGWAALEVLEIVKKKKEVA